MRRRFKFPLSGLVLMLCLSKNSIVLLVSGILFGLSNSFKPATSYLIDPSPFFLGFEPERNRTTS